jgi:hypothetical protein
MDVSNFLDLTAFLIITIGGSFLVAKTAGRLFHDHKFRPSRYFLLILSPLIASIVAYDRVGVEILYLFVIVGFLGFILEYGTGKVYSIVVGRRLWRYYRDNLNENTSWLSMPLWGFAGILFFLLSRLFY